MQRFHTTTGQWIWWSGTFNFRPKSAGFNGHTVGRQRNWASNHIRITWNVNIKQTVFLTLCLRAYTNLSGFGLLGKTLILLSCFMRGPELSQPDTNFNFDTGASPVMQTERTCEFGLAMPGYISLTKKPNSRRKKSQLINRVVDHYSPTFQETKWTSSNDNRWPQARSVATNRTSQGQAKITMTLHRVTSSKSSDYVIFPGVFYLECLTFPACVFLTVTTFIKATTKIRHFMFLLMSPFGTTYYSLDVSAFGNLRNFPVAEISMRSVPNVILTVPLSPLAQTSKKNLETKPLSNKSIAWEGTNKCFQSRRNLQL